MNCLVFLVFLCLVQLSYSQNGGASLLASYLKQEQQEALAVQQARVNQIQQAPQQVPVQPQPTHRPQNYHPPAPVHFVKIGTKLEGDYDFGYDTGMGSAGQSFRKEKRLPDGTVEGAYGYVDTDGKKRIVRYRADKHGFKASGDLDPEGVPRGTAPGPQHISQQQAARHAAPQPHYGPPAQQQYGRPPPQYSPQNQYRGAPPQQAPTQYRRVENNNRPVFDPSTLSYNIGIRQS
ncbi:endocuticle structural glycoprotein SgAbd-1-like [Limulus polyphemus]|uniref:Endocuticle structural glycoprotein SgAbd-1-like n=1 Tax=Limulus polyphemus TaxID=6850 RepID=A0ABM1T6W6_LIMPO|nr:endocuticle structural glycoprotein SgAbd-1-like [Limulus polyphemus]